MAAQRKGKEDAARLRPEKREANETRKSRYCTGNPRTSEATPTSLVDQPKESHTDTRRTFVVLRHVAVSRGAPLTICFIFLFDVRTLCLVLLFSPVYVPYQKPHFCLVY